MDKLTETNLILSRIGQKNGQKPSGESFFSLERHILVVVDLPAKEARLALREIAALRRFGYLIDAVIRPSSEPLLKGIPLNGTVYFFEREADDALLERVDAVVVAAGQDLLARVSLGLQDHLGSWSVLRALWLGIDVFADFTQACAPFEKESGNPGLTALFSRYTDLLRSMGVLETRPKGYLDSLLTRFRDKALSSTTPDAQPESAVAHPPAATDGRVIITERDILARPEGSVLQLSGRATVTPLAFDTAKKRNIQIIRA